MTTDEPAAAADGPPPAMSIEDWVKDTRDRLSTAEPLAAPIVPKPSRFVRRWVLGPLFVTACWMSWLAWNSPAGGSQRPVEVAGRFHDIYEQPVSNALVFLVSDPKVQTRTHADGSFRLPGVPYGNQTLIVVQEDMGEEFPLLIQQDVSPHIGDLVYGVPPMSVRRGPGGGADWGKK